MNRFAGLLTVGMALPVFAVPQIANVGIAFDQDNCNVTVSYDLSEDAIVTVEFEVDGQPVSGPACWRISGDVHKRVTAGEGRTFRWRPDLVAAAAAANTKVAVWAWTDANPPPVFVQDLCIHDVDMGRRYYQSFADLPGGIQDKLYKTTKMVFVRIPAKGVTWQMGQASGASGATLHKVTFTYDYYMAVYPLTQRQYLSIGRCHYNYNLTHLEGKGDDTGSSYTCNDGDDWDVCPVDYMYKSKLINIWDSIASAPYKVEGNSLVNAFRVIQIGTDDAAGTSSQAHIPTEAEWEYACRAGNGELLNVEGAELDEIAWHSGNSGGRMRPVGLKKPNAWGLYDMIGNVWEVCRDTWTSTLTSADQTDPANYSWGWDLVSRGGAFNEDAANVHSAARRLCTKQTAEGVRLMIKIPDAD
ncbi:MAG: formylglycine-generating enzyme family protein [Kiritimatiellia bacterium]